MGLLGPNVWGTNGRPGTNEGGRADARKLLAVLTSTVREAVEDVAFVTQALEAPGRVDAEMVAGAVEGALVDVCAQRERERERHTCSEKHQQMTKNGPSPSSFVFAVWRSWPWAECYDAENDNKRKGFWKEDVSPFVTCGGGQPPGVATFTISRHRNGIFNSFVK